MSIPALHLCYTFGPSFEMSYRLWKTLELSFSPAEIGAQEIAKFTILMEELVDLLDAGSDKCLSRVESAIIIKYVSSWISVDQYNL